MSHPVKLWSKAYAPSVDTDPFSIQVEKSLWQEAMRSEGSRRKFLRIEHPEGFEDWIAPIGQPVSVEESHLEDTFRNLYLPLWMIDAGQFSGEGQEAVVDILDEDFFPQATKIVLRVIDSAFYNADIKVELERALSAIGVIKQHSTLQIPVEALGGFIIEVFVSETEPANIVLCDGEEVAVEFQEPVDQIAPPARPLTPIPQPPAMVSTDGMIPEGFLGHSQRDTSRGFQAFQGQGHTIGTSNVNIPEWRRELGPPKRPTPKNG
jgi:hypothetical protein